MSWNSFTKIVQQSFKSRQGDFAKVPHKVWRIGKQSFNSPSRVVHKLHQRDARTKIYVLVWNLMFLLEIDMCVCSKVARYCVEAIIVHGSWFLFGTDTCCPELILFLLGNWMSLFGGDIGLPKHDVFRIGKSHVSFGKWRGFIRRKMLFPKQQ